MPATFLVAALALTSAAPAQVNLGRVPPLVYVRFLPPAGTQVGFFQGSARVVQESPAPVTVGVRPGYVHRVRLAEIPGRPGLMLFPTIEVKGALCLSPGTSTSRYPVPVPITEQDIDHIVNGRFITKVVYLEDPDRATPVATKPDQPLELELPPDRDILWEAHQLGRPMLVLRIGSRVVPEKELAEQTVPGTVLLPGQGVLPLPPVAPCLPWAGVQLFDPKLGPKPPTEECLRDGGDLGWPAGVDQAGRLGGVEPADTVAEYRDSAGRFQVVKSNKVCVCVPRFAVLRSELPLFGYDVYQGLAGAAVIHERGLLELSLPPRPLLMEKSPEQTVGRMRPSANLATQAPALLAKLCVLQAERINVGLGVILDVKRLDNFTQLQRTEFLKQLELARELSILRKTEEAEAVVGTQVLGKLKGLDVISATLQTRDLTICCNEAPHTPEKPLVLWKWADRCAAQVGDVVTFTIKYSNHGGRPITDVAVVDSLTGRLEYVEGSAKSDREAVFTQQPNEAGSMVLRWEVTGELLPGQSGVVSFQARVR